MQITKQNWLATIINFAVTLFFLSIFIVKGGYNAAPAILMLIGLGYGVYALIKKPLLNLSKVDKYLIYSYLFYFVTFVLSLSINGGKMRDLDTASRVVFFVPVLLLLLKYPIKTCVLSYSIPLGSIISLCVALYDKFILNLRPEQNPRIMHIQGGDISMSLGIFSLIIALYAHQKKDIKLTTLSVIGGLCGIVGRLLSTAHAHNQYLDDLSKRGIVGLLALLAVLFIPLRAFMKKLSTTNDEVNLIATLGVAHILSVMIYGLSQGFLVHNSGTIFYFFLTIVFYAAIRTHQKAE